MVSEKWPGRVRQNAQLDVPPAVFLLILHKMDVEVKHTGGDFPMPRSCRLAAPLCTVQGNHSLPGTRPYARGGLSVHVVLPSPRQNTFYLPRQVPALFWTVYYEQIRHSDEVSYCRIKWGTNRWRPFNWLMKMRHPETWMMCWRK